MFGKGKNRQNKLQKRGMGSTQLGVCSCPKCNYSVAHKRGVPCFKLICPKCNIPLIRQDQPVNDNKQKAPKNTAKTSNYPTVNTELCIGCGACIDICPTNAINLADGKAVISIEKCKKCKACVKVCPVEAIS